MIRKLTQEEYNNAADLSYQVCMERNDFTQEGIETFKSFVYDTSLDYMMSNCNFTYITVNSSTYAETFYTSLGFKKVGEKEINKGIVSIPMERNI